MGDKTFRLRKKTRWGFNRWTQMKTIEQLKATELFTVSTSHKTPPHNAPSCGNYPVNSIITRGDRAHAR